MFLVIVIDNSSKKNNSFNIQNISFKIETIDDIRTDSEEKKKNPYLKKEDIPKIEIINQNTMIYEEKEYQIKDYLNQIKHVLGKIKNNIDESLENTIKDNQDELLEVFMKYN